MKNALAYLAPLALLSSPARSTVQAVLPNEAALVEIDVVALQ